MIERIASEGLLAAGRPVVVLLSGGRDSVCLLHVAVRIAGASSVAALHCNYGLREGSDGDEELCREVCERLGVPVTVERPRSPRGNLQAWARDQRYAHGARLALELRADLAAGHTATDQVETVLYRLAASPGRRALLGMRPRDGRLIRPLLGFTREETAAWCAEHGLPWREDEGNEDPAFARNRIRHVLVEALRGVHPAAERNVLATLGLLRDEAEVLDALVADVLAAAGRRGAGAGVSIAALGDLAPALARLALQRMADEAAGTAAPAVGARAAEILALGAGGGTASLDLGGGLRAVVAYGELRFEAPGLGGDRAVPAPAELVLPGAVDFGGGRLSGAVGPAAAPAEGTLDAARLAERLEVRAWRPGDRMRPLGLGGSRSLQDLFTDRKIPREQRGRTPVVVSAGEIAWVPGVATGEAFRVTEATERVAQLVWAPPGATLPPAAV